MEEQRMKQVSSTFGPWSTSSFRLLAHRDLISVKLEMQLVDLYPRLIVAPISLIWLFTHIRQRFILRHRDAVLTFLALWSLILGHLLKANIVRFYNGESRDPQLLRDLAHLMKLSREKENMVLLISSITLIDFFASKYPQLERMKEQGRLKPAYHRELQTSQTDSNVVLMLETFFASSLEAESCHLHSVPVPEAGFTLLASYSSWPKKHLPLLGQNQRLVLKKIYDREVVGRLSPRRRNCGPRPHEERRLRSLSLRQTRGVATSLGLCQVLSLIIFSAEILGKRRG